MKNRIFTIAMLALILGSTQAIAQNAAINSTGAAPNASAMLDVSSTTKGLLAPRMTAVQIAAIASPATGLLVYQTDGTDGFYYYDGAGWVMLITGNASDLTSGTVGTARLGTGTADNTTYLRGDGAWTTPGSSAPSILTKTANYTILAGDVTNNLILISNSGTTRVYTLPTAASVATGNTIKITSNNMDFDIATSGADVLLGVYGSGATTSSTFYIVELTSNGTDAWIITDALK